MIVVGLDTSLTATGVAHVFTKTGDFGTYTLKSPDPGKVGEHGRLDFLLKQIEIACADVDLAVMEAPAPGAKGNAGHSLAGLWWLVRHQLWTARIPTAVMNPMHVKKYACGDTKADKDRIVLATARRFEQFDGDNNAADALWLAHAGADHLGHPIVTLPQAQRAALDAVTWPALTGRN